MKTTKNFLIFSIIGFALSAQAELKFKDNNTDYQISTKTTPVVGTIEGNYSTYMETDWNAHIEIKPKGQLMVEIVAQDENMDKPVKNLKKGTWAIEKDLLTLKYGMEWIKYEFYPRTKTFIEKEPLDVLKPVSSSKDHLLKAQYLHRVPIKSSSKK
jgi:hypothetical protein